MAHLTREKIEALRSEYRNRNICGKYPRQKMLPEYRQIYKWLLPDETDPYFVFCTICECRLRAKRCDLGKHEDSIKHTENAAKKSITKAAPPTLEESGAFANFQDIGGKEEYDDVRNDSVGNEETYIKQETNVDMAECSNSQMNSNTLPYQEEEPMLEQDDGADEEDDSSDSSSLGYLPLQVSITEPSPMQQFSITELPRTTAYNTSTQFHPSQTLTPHPPCKITIKKITAPIPPSITSPHITPTLNKESLSTNALTITQQQQPQQLNVSTTHSTSVPGTRDPFDLFFDSICQSVKALPPKLATEGKIRVMQIIGELEMRAITEREGQANNNCNSSNNQTGQQNATVASTTI